MHTHTHTAHNVLVFDGGRTVKLSDFGSAVAIGKSTTMQGLKGCTPYFAAPEVIKGDVPKSSADIWSVFCVLVELLTARWPGCQQVDRNETAMLFMVSLSRVLSVMPCATVMMSTYYIMHGHGIQMIHPLQSCTWYQVHTGKEITNILCLTSS